MTYVNGYMQVKLEPESVDELVIAELKDQLQYALEMIKNYEEDLQWVHEEDYKFAKKRKKAFKVILEYYGVDVE